MTYEQIDQLVRAACHSDPVMASGEYCLTIDEVRAILQAASAEPQAGHCVEGDRCVCGGDTPMVRAGCGNWRKPAAAPASAAPVVPEGWKLVPIEPTHEMADAGRQADFDEECAANQLGIIPERAAVARAIYRAMLAAAPHQLKG